MGYAPAETMATMMETVPPEAWLAEYEASKFGKWQAQQPLRYPDWEYDDREQKLADLGPDVHPVQHMVVTERMVRGLLQFEDSDLWTPEEIYVARVQALLHDIGESTHPELQAICGKVVGDIPHGKKSDEDRAAEARVRETVYDIVYPDMPVYLRDRLEALIWHREDSRTHQALEAVHDTGFLQVGLRAGRLALRELGDGIPPNDRLVKLGQLAVEVTNVAVPRIKESVADFPYISRVFTKAAPLYNRIQEELG